MRESNQKGRTNKKQSRPNQLRSRSSLSHIVGLGSFGSFGSFEASGVWAPRQRSKTQLFTAPGLLCVRTGKQFIAPLPLGSQKRMLLITPEPLCTRKHCYQFLGIPKHLLFLALEPNPLYEFTFGLPFEIKFRCHRTRVPVTLLN